MKTRILTHVPSLLLLMILSNSCVSELSEKFEFQHNEEGDFTETNTAEEDIYAEFDFKTVQEYQVEIRALDPNDAPISGANIQLYVANPLDATGQLKENAAQFRIFDGVSNPNGRIETIINPALIYDSLYILPNYIGLATLYAVPLQGEHIDLVIGGVPEENQGIQTGQVRSNTPPPVTKTNGFYVLGSWHSNGTPYYLEPSNVTFESKFISELNDMLPSGQSIPNNKPELMDLEEDGSLHLTKPTGVEISFVAESGHPNNALGYFTYPTNNPPSSFEDVKDQLTIIFPRLQKVVQGNTVKLYYLDPEKKSYSETFPAGTSIGWFLIKDGFPKFRTGESDIFYSHPKLNTFLPSNFRKHHVTFYDRNRAHAVIAFENPTRTNKSDDDFNDAIFTITPTDPTALNTEDLANLNGTPDFDGDGVNDLIDQYPEDKDKAFNNIYPAPGLFGTLAYEDLWPHKGDYDFNDLVVNYQYNLITNADNQISTLKVKIKVVAIGASFRNGMAVELRVPYDRIASVVGNQIDESYLRLQSNGTEAGQTNAVIFFFDNAHKVLEHPGVGTGINTQKEAPFVEPAELDITINFNHPVPVSQMGAPPYNPFIVVNGDRNKEIHLPSQPPTDLADMSIFGTGDDDSDPAIQKFYQSDNNLPWGLNIPSEFEYPAEKRIITQAYIHFDAWAKSRGVEYPNWYIDNAGYKNLTFIYRR